MTSEQMKYCRGCEHLNRAGTPTCDFLAHTGHSRGCPVGDGCQHHTKLEIAAAEELMAADVRKMFDAGATVKEIAATMSWGISKTHAFLRKHGMTRAPGWNKKGTAKPKIEQPQKADIECPVEKKPEPAPAELEGIKLGEFLAAIKALLPEKLHGAALYIDGTQVKELYGYSVTMPEGRLTVDLFTTR